MDLAFTGLEDACAKVGLHIGGLCIGCGGEELHHGGIVARVVIVCRVLVVGEVGLWGFDAWCCRLCQLWCRWRVWHLVEHKLIILLACRCPIRYGESGKTTINKAR